MGLPRQEKQSVKFDVVTHTRYMGDTRTANRKFIGKLQGKGQQDVVEKIIFHSLKSSGENMYHPISHSTTPYFDHRVYLFASYNRQNK
jgi:hypothetical protein